MAGTIFGLGLAVQYDASGVIAPGALLYVYQASTSTPVTTYADFSLSTAQTWPIVADGAGRLPQFWVADGSYRVRLTTAAGVTIFDESSITAIGASSGSSGGSSGGVDETTIFQTGDVLWVPYSGTRSGWVRANARTIGSASSSATERANSDCSALFDFLWTNFSDSLCPVSGGRGASSSADFSANKRIGILDMRGRSMFGLDDMGNTAASVIAAGTPTTAGSGSGAETVTISQANLPNVNLVASSLTGSVNTALTNATNVVRNLNAPDFATYSAGAGAHDVFDGITAETATLSLSSGTVTFGGNVPLGGSGTATNKMPPYRLGSFYFKL